MLEISKQQVIEYLSHCSDAEMRAVLQAVFQVRTPNPEEAHFNRNCYFLGAESSTLEDAEEGEPERWDPYRIEAIAYVDEEIYGVGRVGIDWGFCQFGECEQCGVSVRSDLKFGICPICNGKVGMS
jgi:hypothetical protein